MKQILNHNFSKDQQAHQYFQIKRLDSLPQYDPSVAHKHNYYQIFYIQDAQGYIEIDYEEMILENNCLYFVSPGQVHRLVCKGGLMGYVIHFSNEFYELASVKQLSLLDLAYLNNNSSLPVVSLASVAIAEFDFIFDALFVEFSKECYSQTILWSYLNILLLRSDSYYEPQHGEKYLLYNASSIILQYKKMIDSHFMQMQSVQSYADKLCVSPEYLNDECKKVLTKNASELIADRITLEAKRMLVYSDRSNKEIAFSLNFNDPSYFSRFFKKKTGFSPKEFRTMTLKKYS